MVVSNPYGCLHVRRPTSSSKHLYTPTVYILGNLHTVELSVVSVWCVQRLGLDALTWKGGTGDPR